MPLADVLLGSIWIEIRGMTPVLAVVLIGGGIILLIISFNVKEFYAIKGLSSKLTDQKIDPDLGRGLLWLIGAAAILSGLFYFIL